MSADNLSDVRNTLQAKAHRLAQSSPGVTSIIEVDFNGVAVEKYTVGNQTGLGVTDAIELMEKPGLRVIKEAKTE